MSGAHKIELIAELVVLVLCVVLISLALIDRFTSWLPKATTSLP